jgi:hypothetical protein
MVPKPLKTPSKVTFSAYRSMIRKSGYRFSEKIMLKQKGSRKTLTLRAPPPIRPRFLEMDVILDPRGPRASEAF